MNWEIEIQTRFSDFDGMGHLNNAVYLSYMETARLEIFANHFGNKRDWKSEGFILRTINVEYLAQLKMGVRPKVVLSCIAIGNTSFTLGYSVEANGIVFAKATSVLVSFSYNDQKTIAIPADLREILSQNMHLIN